MTDLTAFYAIIGTLFLLMATGFVGRKLGVITDVYSKGFSKLIISIGQPLLIIHSLISTEYSTENLKLGGKVVLIGLAVHLTVSVIAYLATRPIKNLDESKICEFAMVFANCGFLGFPVLEALFGARGLFMGGFFIISFHLTVWTWGIAILARKRSDIKLTWKKILINYGTVPCTIGFLLYLFRVPIPASVMNWAGYLGNLCTPISMLITGALIATKPLKEFFTNIKIYYVALIRLFVVPMLICLVASLIGLPEELVLFATVMASFPPASMVSMLADLYDIEPGFASQMVGLPSLLSMGTMPLVLTLAQKIIEWLI